MMHDNRKTINHWVFCNWNIVFLEKQKAVCSKSMVILNVMFQAEPRCSRLCLLVLHGKAACTLGSACSDSEPRVQCSHLLHGHKLSDRLRLITHLIRNSFLPLGHSETLHCCQIFSHTPTVLYNPWGDDPQFKKLWYKQTIHFSQF